MSFGGMEITETTTVREVLSAFSAEEQACIREAIGAELIDSMADVPVASLPEGASAFPVQCIGAQSVVDFAVANISAEAGGLSPETVECITEIATENPGIVGAGPPPESFGEVIAGAVRMQLCLTDEEAAAMAANQGVALPSPSQLQCLEDQLGGEEALLAMLTDESQAEQGMMNLFSAAMACVPGEPMATPTG